MIAVVIDKFVIIVSALAVAVVIAAVDAAVAVAVVVVGCVQGLLAIALMEQSLY